MEQSDTWTKMEYDEGVLYKDRRDAAEFLAKKLKQKFVTGQLKKEDTVVLAIPRGGVVIGDVLAERLGVQMDVIISRKIGSPGNPELALGAVMHDRSFFANKDIIKMLGVSTRYIDEQIDIQKKEIERHLLKFRGSKEYHLKGKSVILVDDGIATGATVFVALNWLRNQQVRKLIVAVPVGPKDTIFKLKAFADDVVVLQSHFIFGAVGEFYQDFQEVTDDEVVKIMRKYVIYSSR